LGASILNNLGQAYLDAGKLDDAEALISAAMKIVGESHPSYPTYLDNVGRVHSARGDHRKALEATAAAAKLFEKGQSTTHPDYLLCLGNLAGEYEASGDLEKAVKALQRKVELTEKAEGSTGALVGALSQLGRIHLEEGRTKEAEAAFVKAA